ncbi:MAG: hypothetical protein FWG69_00535 [Oscillospiraceae bacterium]|nr:hypothetical protein [Oscillospiraceae bacterium]
MAQQALDLIREAERKAADLVRDARTEAEDIINNAEKDAAKAYAKLTAQCKEQAANGKLAASADAQAKRAEFDRQTESLCKELTDKASANKHDAVRTIISML